MTDVGDRTVHAENERRSARIVRYDRAGKWYREVDGVRRLRVTVEYAAENAVQPDWVWYEGLPGGQKFDALVRRKLAWREGVVT